MLSQKLEQPRIFKIKEIIEEALGYKTFLFAGSLKAQPGQFVLLWLPRIDAKPFSIAYEESDLFAITVKKVGPFTQKVFELKKEAKVGIQGPYGTYFRLGGEKKIIVIGGGCGAPPVFFLSSVALKAGLEVDFILAAKSKEDLIFEKKLKKMGVKVYQKFTEQKSSSLEILVELLKKQKYDGLFACGPELMLKKITNLAQAASLPVQISLERYMKCGFGICGQCSVDPLGIRLCQEGPVVSGKLANQILEFGQYRRNAAGRKVKF